MTCTGLTVRLQTKTTPGSINALFDVVSKKKQRVKLTLLHERRIVFSRTITSTTGLKPAILTQAVGNFAGDDWITVRATSFTGNVCAATVVITE